MGKSHLQEVANSLRVVGGSFEHLIKRDDPVFFKKEQLKLGSVLKYYGRHAPNTTWIVTKIYYFHWYRGQLRSHKNTVVIKLDDAIEVKCKETGAIMELSFQYLSYSAIWRLHVENI